MGFHDSSCTICNSHGGKMTGGCSEHTVRWRCILDAQDGDAPGMRDER